MRLALTFCALLASVPAQGQSADAPIHFDQPAQPLAAALRSFARTAGEQVAFDGDALARRSAPAIKGRMTRAAALERLLRGSGLVARRGRTGILIIVSMPRATVAATRPTPPVVAVPVAPPETPEAELLVTARKREERAIDVPIALSSTDGRQIEQEGAGSVADVLQRSPGVGLYDQGNGLMKLTIRGVSTSLGANENGYYLDDLPFTGVTVPISPDVRAWDLDRVEVLRGPQGTLFGEGSLGGTVRILTRGADLDYWEAKGAGFVSHTQDGGTNRGVKGAFNAPIVPGVLALRVAGTAERFAGWIDNPTAGATNVNDQTYTSLRAKLRFDPTSRLSIAGSYWQYSGNFPGGGAIANDAGEQSRLFVIDGSTRYRLYGATARYDFGHAELFYGYSHNSFSLPQSGSFLGGTFVGSIGIKVDAHELRLTSTGPRALQWTFGGYARDARRRDGFEFGLFGIDNRDATDSRARALFGEATYRLPFASIDLTAGLRYFEEKLGGFETNSGIVTPDAGDTYRSLNPRFSLAWHPVPNTTVYASAAKGFRAGQLQPTASLALAAAIGRTLPVALDQDSIWTYEIGAKAELFDRSLVVEGALFHSDWSDVTVRVPIGTSGFNGLINSKGARIRGGELALVVRPARGLSFSAGGALIDSTYAGLVPGTGIVSGAVVDDIARFTANASVEFRRPVVAGIVAFVQADWQHSSRRRFVAFPGFLPGDAVDRIDLRLGIDMDRFSIALFGENLGNDNGALSYRSVVPIGTADEDVTAYRPRPRTIGLQASFRFGGPP